MAITDLYSKRRTRELGQVPDVYQYDQIPAPLRVQIAQIFDAIFGIQDDTARNHCFRPIVKTLCAEYGVEELGAGSGAFDVVKRFLKIGASPVQVLDVVEVAFDRFARGQFPTGQSTGEAIQELNTRFRELGIGYQYGSGQIVRIDSQFVHSIVVQPALHFLASQEFAGANEEKSTCPHMNTTGMAKPRIA